MIRSYFLCHRWSKKYTFIQIRNAFWIRSKLWVIKSSIKMMIGHGNKVPLLHHLNICWLICALIWFVVYGHNTQAYWRCITVPFWKFLIFWVFFNTYGHVRGPLLVPVKKIARNKWWELPFSFVDPAPLCTGRSAASPALQFPCSDESPAGSFFIL